MPMQIANRTCAVDLFGKLLVSTDIVAEIARDYWLDGAFEGNQILFDYSPLDYIRSWSQELYKD
jgi:hypothetical protein